MVLLHPFWILKTSVPIYCNYMEKSDKYIIPNISFCLQCNKAIFGWSTNSLRHIVLCKFEPSHWYIFAILNSLHENGFLVSFMVPQVCDGATWLMPAGNLALLISVGDGLSVQLGSNIRSSSAENGWNGRELSVTLVYFIISYHRAVEHLGPATCSFSSHSKLVMLAWALQELYGL